jgi:hypothetical protein
LPNDINANTAKLKIQYELMKRGYEKANVMLPQRFADNYKRVFEGKETALDRCEKEGFLGNLTINKTNSIQKEDDMSERKLTPNSIIVSGLTDRKFTDEEIVANVQREFPDEKDTKHLLTRVFLVRSAINGGRMLKDWAEKNGRIEKLVRVDGKLVAKTTLPKAEPKRKAKPTVDPANDPLKKTAGIDLAKKPTAKDKAANVENKKAMPKKPVAKKPEAKVAPKVAAKKVNAPAKKKSEGVKV